MYNLDCIYAISNEPTDFEKLICSVTQSKFSHAATGVEFEGVYRIVHATTPAVHASPGNYFDDLVTKEIISLPITEEQRKAVVEKAFELLGKKYGFDDCIEGGIRDIGNRLGNLFGDEAVALVHKIIDDPNTYNCSGTQVELVRAAFPNFAEGIDSSTVTPEQARLMVTDFYNQIVPQEV
jgi:hypothetical protein